MNIAVTVSRILLGLLFLVAGGSVFFNTTPPPIPGMTGDFLAIFMKSHWSMFVGAAQLVLGVMLLVNRFVPVALIMLAAFLYNSLAFHITMFPGPLPIVVVVILLWFVISWKYRRLFAPIFAAQPTVPGEAPTR